MWPFLCAILSTFIENKYKTLDKYKTHKINTKVAVEYFHCYTKKQRGYGRGKRWDGVEFAVEDDCSKY